MLKFGTALSLNGGIYSTESLAVMIDSKCGRRMLEGSLAQA